MDGGLSGNIEIVFHFSHRNCKNICHRQKRASAIDRYCSCTLGPRLMSFAFTRFGVHQDTEIGFGHKGYGNAVDVSAGTMQTVLPETCDMTTRSSSEHDEAADGSQPIEVVDQDGHAALLSDLDDWTLTSFSQAKLSESINDSRKSTRIDYILQRERERENVREK